MCEAFQVEDLALMIRATRGRSRRPNHMHSHLDALQAMRPVSLRRVASEVHSVAKQALFYIAFGVHFQGFWEFMVHSIFHNINKTNEISMILVCSIGVPSVSL